MPLDKCLGLAFSASNRLAAMPVWCHLLVVDRLVNHARWQQLYFTVIFFRGRLDKTGAVSLYLPCQIEYLVSCHKSLVDPNGWLNNIINSMVSNQGTRDDSLIVDPGCCTISFDHFVSRQPNVFNLWCELPRRFDNLTVEPRIPREETTEDGTFLIFNLPEEAVGISRFSAITSEDRFHLSRPNDFLTITGPYRMLDKLRVIGSPDYSKIVGPEFCAELIVDIMFVGADGQSDYSLSSHVDSQMRKRPQVINSIPDLPEVLVEAACFPPSKSDWVLQLKRSQS